MAAFQIVDGHAPTDDEEVRLSQRIQLHVEAQPPVTGQLLVTTRSAARCRTRLLSAPGSVPC